MQHLGVTQTDRVIYVFQLHGRPLHYCNPTEVELRGPPGRTLHYFKVSAW